MLLGCIGDDFTGSSDLANTLVKNGMKTTLYCGVPETPAAPEAEAGVVALKSRTVPVCEAVETSLAALRWLRDQGCQQFFFKYCSTFDSTPDGNIGPVAEALLQELGAATAIVCPAFPDTGRMLYQGHLFVWDHLLNESGMQDHPLTPMSDPDIRRWLRAQTQLPVHHIAHATVRNGAVSIQNALEETSQSGPSLVVVDATSNTDLQAIGQAAASQILITGGSGVAMGLPENFRQKNLLKNTAMSWSPVGGAGVVLSGSCSQQTRAQIAVFRKTHPALEIKPADLISGAMTVENTIDWIAGVQEKTPLVFSSAAPEVVAATQKEFGRDQVAAITEGFFAQLAGRLKELGVTRLVSAGGETSGAIVMGLQSTALEIGPEVAHGVPLLRDSHSGMALALKSGNFGADDFFQKALRQMEGQTE